MDTITFITLFIEELGKILAQNFNSIEKDAQKSFLGSLSWWHYGLILLLIVCLIILFSWLIFRKKLLTEKIPLTRKYNGGSFFDFSNDSGISRNSLFNLNKEILSGYKLLKDETQKEQFKTKLIGKDLVTGFASGNSEILFDSAVRTFQSFEKHKQKGTPKSNPVLDGEIAILMKRIEHRINDAIDSFSSNREALQMVEDLQKENKSLKENFNRSENERVQIIGEREVVQLTLNNLKEEKQKIELENNRYRDKLIFVDFFQPYAGLVSEYFNLVKTGHLKALELFKSMVETDDRNSLIVGQLLMKYQSNLSTKIGSWEESVREIKDNRTTSNLELIRSFTQIQSDEEKLKEFKNILLKEILEKYSDNILILTEELSKLSKFTNTTNSIIKEYEQYFSNFANQLHGKLRIIGLDFKYIPLFENYERFAGHTKLTNQTCSLPYKQVRDLEKDAVLEVVSYGFGNEATKVIVF